MAHAPQPMPKVTRDFTVATFVVHTGRVLMLFHRKLKLWLPPGGHIDPHELPDEAAVREVREEAGIEVELVGEHGVDCADPRQLVRPEGIQLERIAPGHEHIDLIYFARPVAGDGHTLNLDECEGGGWYSPDELLTLGATDEVTQWARRAVAKVR